MINIQKILDRDFIRDIVVSAGWSSSATRQGHNLKIAGSNPAPATNSGDPPMFATIARWFKQELRQVDDVLENFHVIMDRLETVAEQHAVKAEEHAKEILQHTEDKLKAEAEVIKASKILDKLHDLLY